MSYSLFTLMDLGTTFFLAFAAAFRAGRYGNHFTGSVLLGAMLGLASPMLRDVLLAFGENAVLSQNSYLAVAIVGGVLGKLGSLKLPPRVPAFLWTESMSLGWAAAMGAGKGSVLGMGSVGCIIIGVLAATCSGGLRDICLGDTPLALEMDFYVTAAAMGSMVVLAMRVTRLPLEAGICLGALTAVLLCMFGSERRLRQSGGSPM